ncbi:zinc finger protein 2 homolog isoform X2 [Aphidius gifuensis]|nr:zinc finger protein 2 homolog isoform X2 [Aphidius gifuensis]XP_044011254.1 zinc finger protein 2 homolog isoform X2 [Aphidius gifuensis]
MNYYICSNHIEDRYFISKRDNFIRQGAVPTLFTQHDNNNVIGSTELNQGDTNYIDTINNYENVMYTTNFCDINVDNFHDLSSKFINYCRICGDNNIDGIDILTDKGIELKLQEKIHLNLPIIIDDDNNLLPQKICNNCYDSLEISHSLLINCLKTDIRLRKYLNLPKKIDNYNKYQSLITKYTYEIDNEILHDTTADVTTNNKLIETTSITNDCYDNNTIKNCTKIDDEPDINNLLLHQLNDENFENVLNNSVVSDSENNETINYLPINNDDDNFQAACDNEQVLILTKSKSPIPIFDENNDVNYNNKNDDCNESFETVESSLDIHKKNNNIKINLVVLKRRCGHCSMPFTTKKELQNHIGEKHCDKKILFKCSICDKNYEKWSSLDVHEATHRQDKPYLCDLCGKSFKHSNNLRGHKRTHLDVSKKKKYNCEICSSTFRSRFHLNEHINQHNGSTPYNCEECGKAFSKRIQLRQHKQSHGINKYTCPICNSTFSRRGNMNSHIKRHNNSTGMYKCSVCDCQFKTMSDIKKHRKQHTKNEIFESIKKKNINKPIHQCNICLRIFTKYTLLLNHERIHNGEQIKFECDKCGKKLSSKNSLKYHIRSVHTTERPHICQYCDDSFVSKYSKLIHERVHTGERPYACNNCDMRYRSSSNLSQHMKLHLNERPHICQYCSKNFTRKCALIDHERTHTGIKPHLCLICGKKFSQKNDLTKHCKIHYNKLLKCEKCNEIFLNKTDILKHLENNHLDNAIKKTFINHEQIENYTVNNLDINSTVDLSNLDIL